MILYISFSYLLVLSSLITSSYNLSTCQYSSSKTFHFLEDKGPSFLASERGHRHPLQPGSCRAPSTTWGSFYIKAFVLAGTDAPTSAGETALWHSTTTSQTVRVAQFQQRPAFSHHSAQTAAYKTCFLDPAPIQTSPVHWLKGAWLSLIKEQQQQRLWASWA